MHRSTLHASEKEVYAVARNFFINIINFGRSKSRKSSGLVKVLEQIPFETTAMSLGMLLLSHCSICGINDTYLSFLFCY